MSAAVSFASPLLGRPSPPGHRWVVELGVASFPYFADHRIQGKVVLPGSVYLEMALAAATAAWGHAPCAVEDVVFERAFLVPLEGVRALQAVLTPAEGGAWQFAATGLTSGVRHATARIPGGPGGQSSLADQLYPADPVWAHGTEITGAALYDRLRELGNDFGPAFRRIETCIVGDQAAVGVFRAPTVADRDLPGTLLRTTMLDTAMQVLTAATDVADHTFALVGCERLELYRPASAAGRIYARLRRARNDAGELVGDALLVDDGGSPTARLTGVRLRCLPLARAKLPRPPAASKLAVTATFTAEPLKNALSFWFDTLGIPTTVEFASNHPPCQQLLDRTSLLSTNTSGANVILVRAEDLVGRPAGHGPSDPGVSLGDRPRFTVPGVGEIAHLVPYETEFLYDEIFRRRTYLGHGIELCDGACVFDVGANIGMFTLFVQSQCDGARIYAFEPCPPAYDVLRLNTSAHCPAAVLFPCGVAGDNAELPFTFYRNSPAFSNFTGDAGRDRAAIEAVVRSMVRTRLPENSPDIAPLVEQLMRGRLDAEIYRCRTRTLSSVLREHDVATIDLLKIDAEGSEAGILAGIEEAHWPRIQQIVAEVHDPAGCKHMRELLERRGFQVVVDTAGALLRDTGFAHLFARRMTGATARPRTPAWTRALESNAGDLVRAVESSRRASRVPCIVAVCPPSARMLADPDARPALARLDQHLADGLAGIPGVAVVTAADLARSYPVPGYADTRAEQLGRIPYTNRFFAALGTMIARRYLAFQQPPVKVIALDCDNTLWAGVCGEDGPSGVRIDAGRRALQAFVVRQHDAGTLVCLCSKNDPADVREVFARRSDMPLTLGHIAASRCNWDTKSESLASLSQELGLGLDGFVFLDDDPIECAEVRANLPAVLTLCLPRAEEELEPFLAHVWAFDRNRLTEEDRARAAHHRQERQRRASRETAMTFASFIAGLELRVTAGPCSRAELPRVAQLTQRTNQFTSTAIRRTEAELQVLIESGTLECRTVRAQDRFGDYGLVGAALWSAGDGALRVDSFLLSCRALGRGVEHRMLAMLGQIARERGLDRVEVAFVPTGRNEPARRFFEAVSDGRRSDGRGVLFTTASETASQLIFDPTSAAARTEPPGLPEPPELPERPERPELRDRSAPAASRAAGAWSLLYQRIATDLRDLDAIVDAIERERITRRPVLRNALAGPNDELERKLVGLWRQVLAVDEVGIDDRFFELGGTSLLAVEVMAKLSDHTGSVVPTISLFENTTIRALAAMLRNQPDTTGSSGQRRGERRRALQRGAIRRPDDA